MEEKQKNLEEMVKVLEEKIAVEELKSRNMTTSKSMAQLESRVDELKNKLRQISQTPETAEPSYETVPGVDQAVEPTEDATQQPSEAVSEQQEEEGVTITAFDDSIVAGQETIEKDAKTGSQKKKRKFF